MSKGDETEAHGDGRHRQAGQRRYPGSTMPASSSSRRWRISRPRNGTRSIAINLSSAFHATRAAIPGMKAKKWGPHHQHGVGARPGRLALQIGLCQRQARHRRLHQDRGAGKPPPSASPPTPSVPAMSGRAGGKNRVPETMAARGLTREQVINDVLLDAQPTTAVRHGGRDCGPGALSGRRPWRVPSPARSSQLTVDGPRRSSRPSIAARPRAMIAMPAMACAVTCSCRKMAPRNQRDDGNQEGAERDIGHARAGQHLEIDEIGQRRVDQRDGKQRRPHLPARHGQGPGMVGRQRQRHQQNGAAGDRAGGGHQRRQVA